MIYPLATAPWSPPTAGVHGLLEKRRRKYQRKQDLAHIKAQWALFQQISADTKDLDDIPHYWPQAQQLGLPAIQYTAREVRSGALFWAFAQKRGAAASAVFAARIQQHLDHYGVSLRDLVWQTDNGGEFKGDFPKALGASQHVRIPPAAHTYQSDVETVHRLEEDEFFDLDEFSGGADFLAKVYTYQLYFNIARPNSHKENLSPWQIIERLAPRSPVQICLLPPVFLDYYLNRQGGYDVPRLPCRKFHLLCFSGARGVLLLAAIPDAGRYARLYNSEHCRHQASRHGVACTAPAGFGLFASLWLPIPGLLLAGIGFGIGSKQSRKKKLFGSLLLLGMLCAGVISQSACGGGSPINNNFTPPGQYNVMMTATSGSIVHSQTITLHVQ